HSFVPHALGVGNRSDADAISLCLRKEFAALHLGFAVDDLGLGHGLGSLNSCGRLGFGVLDGHLLVRFGLKFGLFNLLLFEGQRVLHGVRLGLGLQHSHLGLALGLLYLLRLGGFGFKFRNPNLLFLDFSLHRHLIVLLFFEQKILQALRVFRRQLDIAQHDFFHDDAV